MSVVPDRLQAFHFGPEERRLFGVVHPAQGKAHAAVLVCPPLLHELQRSYRFFSGLAGMLGELGLACMRFDYHGTGDSAGDTTAFSPARTGEDIALAAEALRHVADDAPLIVMGVRASAVLARAAAMDVRASALWLWQPVLDAGAYLRELDALDARERSSRARYPLRAGAPSACPGELMGTLLAPGFRDELLALDVSAADLPLPVAVIDAEGAPPQGIDAAARIVLPGTLASWVGQVELDGVIPLASARRAVEQLVSDMAVWVSTPGQRHWHRAGAASQPA